MNPQRLPRVLRGKTRFVLPNAITALSMVMGMISMYYSFKGQFVTAAWVIMYSVILDKLDGSTARALKASSLFGTELDSFSDFIAFGVAPAFLSFAILTNDPLVSQNFASGEPPIFHFFALIIFVLASAMRLARFNITTVPGSKFMFGMATTVAGGLTTTFILTCYKYIDSPYCVAALQNLPVLMLVFSGLMLSMLPIAKVGSKRTLFNMLLEGFGFILVIACTAARILPDLLLVLAVLVVSWGFISAYRFRDQIMAELHKVDAEAEEASEELSE